MANEKSPNFINLATHPKIRDDRRDLAFYFPIGNKIKSISGLKPKNPDNLKITLEGSYSITRPQQGAQFIDELSAKFKDSKKYNLVDGTSGIGGDLIYVGGLFKSVTAYEFNPDHAAAIKANCAEYGIESNVTTGDFTKLYKDALDPTTVLWLDPPWGGPDEWKKDNLKLNFYGDQPQYVNDFIKKCFSECKIPACILKCPMRTYLADFSGDFSSPEFSLTKIPIKYNYDERASTHYIFQLVIIKLVATKPKRSGGRVRSRSGVRQRSKSNARKTKK